MAMNNNIHQNAINKPNYAPQHGCMENMVAEQDRPRNACDDATVLAEEEKASPGSVAQGGGATVTAGSEPGGQRSASTSLEGLADEVKVVHRRSI